ncbi:DUF805 domain-containing protein [Bifidobacterium sp. ESL0728]|uniref:DUF805 domain-containing protein n=1 Tax=Bifidobacterium sp. ESL0728 TaxID=2983220 RepID=UPI0023F72CCB|nr:DUF805 domain-containing protein [Bifidobacterium sp. ESL0728]WEV58842.1 DUF805 domain-containing protein [Bifidobacterium sp. ESL0728]
MNDTNPQPNEDYNNPGNSPYTNEGASGASDNPADTSSSSAPQNFVIPDIPPLPGSASQYPASPVSTPQYEAPQATPQQTSQHGAPQATPQHDAPQQTSQHDAPQQTSQSTAQQSAPQYATPQQTPQYEAQQPAPQYDAQQAAPQYNSDQQTPQYDSAQQAPNNVPPQYAANQPMNGQGGAPVYPGNAPGQPYGNPNPNNFAPSMAVPLNLPYYGCPPIEAVKRFFLKYVKFSGRASRSEYWWVQLFLLIVYFVLFFLDGLLFKRAAGFINFIVELAFFIPSLSIAVRRLHDSNKSGWWWLLPYGLVIAGAMITVISVVEGIGGMAISYSSYSSKSLFEAAGAGMMIALIIAFLCMLVGFILEIVLMVLGPKPEGARFDEALPPESLVNGQYMPPANQGNPPAAQYGQYAQPMQQQNAFGEQYPQAPNQPTDVSNPYVQPANPQNPADAQYNQPANQATSSATNAYTQTENPQAFTPGEPQSAPQAAAPSKEPDQGQDSFGQQSPQGLQ